MKIDPKVDEAIETLNMKDGPTRRRLLGSAGIVSASAAAAGLLAACGGSSTSSKAAASTAGNFPKTPAWQFWYVNHVTTNPFFVPTQYGFQDAAALLGLPTPKWGGSQTSLASEMVSYFNTAISAKASGIAYAGIDATSFKTPTMNAMNAGIPVISYNADGLINKGVSDIGSNRLAYVGQALYISGQQLGTKIKTLVPGGGDVVIFIATPGSGNIQPRYDGAVSELGSSYTVHEVATGAATGQELSAEKAFLTGHKTVKGAFAVDAGSTELLGQALGETGLSSIPNGGFDTTPTTLSNLQSGKTNFTIYQDPYLQGFLPTLYFYLYNISGGTISPSDTDTGLTFITKSNAKPYTASSRFQGSTSAQKYIPRASGAISNPPATTST
ncbi:MAG: substrate-binding domain-containing protein [Streptosporangiaceae bacterium]|jgi:simple sugar transport system substrate-binding protein